LSRVTAYAARPSAWAALVGLAVGLGLGTPAAHAGTVVLLISRSLGPYDSTAAGFRAAYRGAIREFRLEDRNPVVIERAIEALHPDAIVAVGLRASLLVRDGIPEVPLVFCAVPDPERHDLSGAWITGISTNVTAATEIEALRLFAPDVKSLGILYGTATGGAIARAARQAATAAGLRLIEGPISDLSQLPARAHQLAAEADALWMPADPAVAAPEVFRYLLELSLASHKPLLVFSEALVRAGALAAVSPDYGWVGAEAAEAVRRIQSGERPGDIPVEPLRRTRFVVNASTARALGRTAPTESSSSVEVLR
jgi:putative ABC transport system substrate-binding protein